MKKRMDLEGMWFGDSQVRLQWCYSHLTISQNITTLMAFFAITTTVELQINHDSLSEALLVAYVSTTCLLVAITVIVKIVGSTILPHLEGVVGSPCALNAPHDQLFDLICVCCLLGNVLAPFLFCLNLQLIAWIKFAHLSQEASLAVSSIMIPVQIIILIFGKLLFSRMRHFRRTHVAGLLPNRRYSEIAELWGETEYSEEDDGYGDSPLLRSGSSATSYGAMLTYDNNLNQFKAYAPFH